jgi:hypothetical protein
MINSQKFRSVIGQVFIGLSFGLGGALVAYIIVYLYSEINQIRFDLFGEIMYTIIGTYIGMLAGIGFDGFRLLKRSKRQTYFLRFMGQSFVGLILGLTLFVAVIPIGQSIPHGLTNFLAIALPLTGAIIGFNFRLLTTEKENG